MTTSNNVWVDSIVGSIAGMASVAAGHPADTIKARLQLDDANRFKSATHCAREILREPRGLQTLFRGLAPPVLAVAGNNALVFFLYSQASSWLRSTPPLERDLSLGNVFWAGTFAGVVQAFAVAPVEYGKIQAQLHGTRPFRFLYSAVRQHGVASVWRGTVVLALREVTYGPYFVVYEAIRRSRLAAHTSDAFASFVAGGAAGVTGWSLAYPLDYVKSRVQAAAPADPPASLRAEWRHFRQAANRGRAWPVVIARAFLVNGVQFLCYEVRPCGCLFFSTDPCFSFCVACRLS